MGNIAYFLLITSAFGLLISTISILLERLAINYGLTRGNTLTLALATFTISFIGRFVAPDSSMHLYGALFAIMGVLAGNRSDLTQTIQRGRYWWK